MAKAKKTKLKEQPKNVGLQCIKCGKTGKSEGFYNLRNDLIDKEKYGLCKSCAKKYVDYEDMETFYRILRTLDVPFIYDTWIKSESSSKDTMGEYLRMVNSLPQYKKLTHKDSDIYKSRNEIEFEINNENYEITSEVELFWGFGFEPRDYVFLESEIEKWKQTHKCDNQAELTLLREICIKILEIRKAREQKNSASKEQKELQDLMKTASVDPAKANVASAGKSHEAFGVWIKEVEQFRPAEWHDQQEKYKDMDSFIPYIKDYIVRPIKNFITGNRDFQVCDNITAISDELEDGDM